MIFELRLLGRPSEGDAVVLQRRLQASQTVEQAAEKAKDLVLDASAPEIHGYELLHEGVRLHRWFIGE